MSNSKEASLILIKPDAMQKNLIGEILTRLRPVGDIVAAKVCAVTRELAAEHYNHIADKPFFEETIDFIMGKLHVPRVMALVYYGDDVIAKIREIAGATNPEEAEPGTIRAGFGRITTKGVYENVIHASSCSEDAAREIRLWFTPEEISCVDLFPKADAADRNGRAVWA